MLNFIRPRLLRFMRVPHDPEPPFGAPGSIKVFRAGKNFYYVRLASWIMAQVGATVGIMVSVGFISQLRSEFDAAQEVKAARIKAAATANVTPAAAVSAPAETPPAVQAEAPPKLPKEMRSKKSRQVARQAFIERIPVWVMPLVEIAELLGIIGFILQLPVTFAAVRLDWELRWYIVTDRSLRIRAGLWSLQESTMSFANLQQVEVTQGPIQRLLGIADVRVQSAGGGGGVAKGHEHHDSLHTGVFHGVDNAPEIRDLILERLRHFRQAGLGDPDDHHQSAEAEPRPVGTGDSLAAARELLEEARAMRRAAG
jgi:membrane protein YdbS with pleckstrin-like domain